MAEWPCTGLQIRLPRFDSGSSLQFSEDKKASSETGTPFSFADPESATILVEGAACIARRNRWHRDHARAGSGRVGLDFLGRLSDTPGTSRQQVAERCRRDGKREAANEHLHALAGK